ncbi:phage antirepressor N-terminal domain-containing protein [Pseudomonas aeruginosa]
MSTAQQLIPVPFYEDTVVLVGQGSAPFVAMKSVVENMGLAWQVQHRKLIERFAATITEMVTVAEDGKLRSMTCLPLRKLPAWLYTISPNKVKPELRNKIIRYQNECDDALWNYWSKGSASRTDAAGVTQQLAVSRHRLALLKELHRTRDRAMREAIHQQLDHVSRLLNLPTPELDSIGWSAPAMPEALARFWDALASLDAKGVEYNHHRTPGLLAINLRGLARLLVEHNQPMLFDRALREALAQSQEPRCLYTNHSVNSQLVGKSVRCWVFEKLQPQGGEK